jgi:class 3 adenylate cyclase
VALGVGIAQGEATLGVIGFEQRWEYAAIGAIPNLAARLCGQAKGGEILVDAATCTAVGNAFDLESVGPITLRGFTQPINAFRVKGMRP